MTQSIARVASHGFSAAAEIRVPQSVSAGDTQRRSCWVTVASKKAASNAAQRCCPSPADVKPHQALDAQISFAIGYSAKQVLATLALLVRLSVCL